MPISQSASQDVNGVANTSDKADGTDGATAPAISAQVAGKDFNGNLQTLFTDTSGRLYVDLGDGVGNAIGSYNGQLSTDDIINTGLTSGTLSVSTTAVAARVSSANLANRKMLSITPTGGMIYLGATSGVTASTGMPIFANQTVTLSFSAAITPFIIATSAVSVFVMEGS